MTPMDSDDVDLAELEAVNEFSYDMCWLYDKEVERRKKRLPALNAIFRCYLRFRLPLIAPYPVSGDRCSDGRAIGLAEVQETIIEIKNELRMGDADSEIQLTVYYIQVNNEELNGQHSGLFKR
jgi:hypothetical protein